MAHGPLEPPFNGQPIDPVSGMGSQEPRSLVIPGPELYPEDPVATLATQEPRSLRIPAEEPGMAQSVGVAVADIPSRLTAGDGIGLDVIGTGYHIVMDIAPLQVAEGQPDQQWLPVWIEGQPYDAIKRVAVNAIPEDAPHDGIVYGRYMGRWEDVTAYVSIDWDDIINVPITFPPSPHVHPISDVTELQNELNLIEIDQTAQDTAINGKEPKITAGAPTDFWAGDKTWKPVSGVISNVYTKGESDARYEPIDTMYTKAESDARYEPFDSAYTKAEADAKYLTPATATATYEPKITAGNASYFWAGDKTWKPTAPFPEAPTDGKTYGRRGQDASWQTIVSGAAISDAPPATPAAGQFWLESDSGTLWVYWADPNSSQWVDVSGNSALGNYLPLSGGTLTDFLTLHAAPTAPLHAATKAYVDALPVGITQAAADVRYEPIDSAYTKAEADARYVDIAGDTMTGSLLPLSSTGPISQASGTYGLEIRGVQGAGHAAFMAFHRPAAFACYFGLDTDNQLAYGGWSLGATRRVLWDSNNFNPGAYLPLGGGTMTGITYFNNALSGNAAATLTFIDVWNTASGTSNNMTVLNSGRICKITSMRAAKTGITPLDDAAGDAILALQPVSFQFKNTDLDPLTARTYYGFIAEDLAETDTHLPTWGIEPERDENFNVLLDEEGQARMGEEPVPNGVDSNAIIAGLVNLVQRQEARIAALEAAIAV